MAELLISFLGPNRYEEAVYRHGDKPVCRTPFCQVAMVHLLRPGFEEVVVLATREAEEANGTELRRAWPEDGPELRFERIDPAASEANIWEIFEVLTKVARGSERVHLDITHSFRFLPMLGFAAMSHWSATLGLPVGNIYYGAFEKDKAETPILELGKFLDVQAWSRALGDFRRHGAVDGMNELIEGHVKPVLKASRGRDAEARALRDVNNALRTWSSACRALRGRELETFEAETAVLGPMRELADLVPPILQEELERTSAFFEELGPAGPENLWHAAKWCARRSLLPQGLTLLQEGMVSVFLKRNPGVGEVVSGEPEQRRFVSEFLNYVGQGKTEAPRGVLAEYPELMAGLLQSAGVAGSGCFASLAQVRNDCNHAGYRRSAARETKLYQSLEDCLEASYPFFFQEGRRPVVD